MLLPRLVLQSIQKLNFEPADRLQTQVSLRRADRLLDRAASARASETLGYALGYSLLIVHKVNFVGITGIIWVFGVRFTLANKWSNFKL